MATIDEIVSDLASATDKVNEAVSALQAAQTAAEDMAGQQAAMGVQDKAAEFAAIKDAVQRAQVHLAGGLDLVDEASTAAKAAGG